jgi:hypothetical protein
MLRSARAALAGTILLALAVPATAVLDLCAKGKGR